MTAALMPAADPFAALAERLRRSDGGALAELFDALHDPLVRYGTRLTADGAQARDFVQEAFIRVWDRRESLDPARSVRALLFRTVRNLAFNATRDDTNRARLLAGTGTVAAGRVAGPDEETDAAELGAQLRAWIGELPERQREVLHLSRFDGLTHDEIAEALGIAPRTVNNHLVRALQTLRARMAEAGVEIA